MEHRPIFFLHAISLLNLSNVLIYVNIGPIFYSSARDRRYGSLPSNAQ